MKRIRRISVGNGWIVSRTNGCALGVFSVVAVMMMGRHSKNYYVTPNLRRDDTMLWNNINITTGVEKIPKIIHQIYLGFDGNRQEAPAIPDQLFRWRENCRAVNSQYEMPLWDKAKVERLIQTKYLFLWETWQGWMTSLEWIKQADAARYIILNEFGGVYMDLDYSCESSPVDSIIANASIVLYRTRPGKESFQFVTNSFMASTPHHWFWGNILPVLVHNAQRPVLAATGPRMLHHVLYDVCGSKPEIQYDTLNRTYHEPDVDKFGIKLANEEMGKGIIRHHWTASWLRPRSSDE
jgi:mannosyltransferase OCH1-like enzyme